MSTKHPCLMCGACCAYYRVQLEQNEVDNQNHSIASHLLVEFPQEGQFSLKGTTKKDPRCAALEGKIGESVSCAIYDQRPNCCRAFLASFEDGNRNYRCDAARKAKNLPPLTPEIWIFLKKMMQMKNEVKSIAI